MAFKERLDDAALARSIGTGEGNVKNIVLSDGPIQSFGINLFFVSLIRWSEADKTCALGGGDGRIPAPRKFEFPVFHYSASRVPFVPLDAAFRAFLPAVYLSRARTKRDHFPSLSTFTSQTATRQGLR